MFNQKDIRSELEQLGFRNAGNIYWNATTSHLYEEIIRRREGYVCHLGPIVVHTGHHMARSPNDRFVVKEPTSISRIWWGDQYRGIKEDRFTNLFYRLQAYFQNKDIFVQDCYAGADPAYRIPLRIMTENAWHSLFARNLFIQMKSMDEARDHVPRFTVIGAPRFHAIPELDGTVSEAFCLLHLAKRLILIGGTSYGGEIKKSVFTALNYVLPQESVLPLHCSTNVGQGADPAIFLGLSGTGKTSLSVDPTRTLIGDDQHGWSETGIFTFEGGGYAKVFRLSREAEPLIHECTRRSATILENVGLDSVTRRVNLDDDSLTENTRAAYPISHIPDADRSGVCGHPKNVIMLTCDASGSMPPVAKLTPDQAVYHFLSGYTARLAGTEIGVNEPQATFSACFGAPFMTLPPTAYAGLFGERIRTHQAQCWLVNTGWVGNPYAQGERIPIDFSRAVIRGILDGTIEQGGFAQEPFFGLAIPKGCEGVPAAMLNPRDAASDPAGYDTRSEKLVSDFRVNFQRFEEGVPEAVLDAGP